jgi:hypothetical protein
LVIGKQLTMSWFTLCNHSIFHCFPFLFIYHFLDQTMDGLNFNCNHNWCHNNGNSKLNVLFFYKFVIFSIFENWNYIHLFVTWLFEGKPICPTFGNDYWIV